MKKLNKTKIKLYASLVALFVVALVAVVGSANAGYVFNWGNVEQKVADKLVAQVPASEEVLGAQASPYVISPMTCINNYCTYTVTGNLTDASTTIVTVADPFITVTSTKTPASPILKGDTSFGYVGNTSTVDRVVITVTGAATSSWAVACGGGANTGSTTTLYGILNSDAFASGDVGIVENNLGTNYTSGGVGGGTIQKIQLTPAAPFLNCKVAPTTSGAFTDGGNSFDGKFTVQISRQL